MGLAIIEISKVVFLPEGLVEFGPDSVIKWDHHGEEKKAIWVQETSKARNLQLIEDLIGERAQINKKLKALGVEVKDGESGTYWTKV